LVRIENEAFGAGGLHNEWLMVPMLRYGKVYVRIGESILLRRYIGTGEPIKGTGQDAFVLAAEMIELKEKPSVPAGELGNNVFGEPIENEKFRIHFRHGSQCR